MMISNINICSNLLKEVGFEVVCYECLPLRNWNHLPASPEMRYSKQPPSRELHLLQKKPSQNLQRSMTNDCWEMQLSAKNSIKRITVVVVLLEIVIQVDLIEHFFIF